MPNTYGDFLKFSIFGSSHGEHLGMQLEGIPAGLPIDLKVLQQFMDRRAPGKSLLSTQRKEADIPIFLSGIDNGKTNGDKLVAMIRNTDARPSDYDAFRTLPRPGHADYTAYIKYGMRNASSGGGQFSGRMTAAMCIAGGLCLQWLKNKGIRIGAHIVSVADVYDDPPFFNWVEPQIGDIGKAFPVLSSEQAKAMQEAILQAKNEGDSLGGVIECAVCGIDAGYGGPLLDGMEGSIAQIIYSIPAVKGIDFGAGFAGAFMKGSNHNDQFTVKNGIIVTQTNNAGGILGGITTGMPVIFQVAFKPTPSIATSQQTVDLTTNRIETIRVSGRHDPCIVPRAVPVVEAAAAIAIFDRILAGG